MSYWQRINPGGAIADFRTVFHQAGGNRWWISIVALIITIGTFSMLGWESWKKPRPQPTITYITSWPEHRTDAETRAFIRENQMRKDAREALEKASEEEARQLWKSIGRASGMDVDAIEARAKAERAAQDAKRQPVQSPAANPGG